MTHVLTASYSAHKRSFDSEQPAHAQIAWDRLAMVSLCGVFWVGVVAIFAR